MSFTEQLTGVNFVRMIEVLCVLAATQPIAAESENDKRALRRENIAYKHLNAV